MVVALEVAGHIGNADVLEVIAEYACGTVKDARALRASNTGYRRAVDTTVRRLVCEDQPLTAPAGVRATLRLHRDSAHLDAVRIAFTCDAFRRIARLVVVAFALDGAKDELREGGVCGTRPVDCSNVPLAEGTDWGWAQAHSDVGPLASAASGPALALQRCRTTAAVLAMTDALCVAAESSGFSSLAHLGLQTADQAAGWATAKRFLRAVGPQLTHLLVDDVSVELCGGIEACTGLRHLHVLRRLGMDASVALCDALIASGAPLESLRLQLDHRVAQSESVRLLAATPTIRIAFLRDVSGSAAGEGAAAAAVLARLDELNWENRPRSRLLEFAEWDEWFPSPHATTLSVNAYTPGLLDLAAAYPELRQLELHEQLDPDVVDRIRLPATLTAFCGEDVCLLGNHGPAGLPHLAKVTVRSSLFVDILPLVPFSSTLREIELACRASVGASDHETLEAALSQLVALETVTVPGLQTVHPFTAGKHARLRTLDVGGLGKVGFGTLVAACPRLIAAFFNRAGVDPVVEGWTASRDRASVEVTRVSFASRFAAP
jgi:hypothetical protein